MTTPSSEAARAEAERRYPVFDNEVTDFSTARRAAFVAGAEWKGAQDALRLKRLAEAARELHTVEFHDPWEECQDEACIMARTLQEEGADG